MKYQIKCLFLGAIAFLLGCDKLTITSVEQSIPIDLSISRIEEALTTMGAVRKKTSYSQSDNCWYIDGVAESFFIEVIEEGGPSHRLRIYQMGLGIISASRQSEIVSAMKKLIKQIDEQIPEIEIIKDPNTAAIKKSIGPIAA